MVQLEMYRHAPHVRGCDTSRAAAESITPHLPKLEALVLGHIEAYSGLTCDEVERDLELSHQTASARIRGLVKRGLVRDGGQRRETRTGRKAIVWVAG